MAITKRTLKRRQAKTRLERRLAEELSNRDAANSSIRDLQETVRLASKQRDEANRELQSERYRRLNVEAELLWIAAHAIAKTIGASKTFQGSSLTDSDCATTEQSRG